MVILSTILGQYFNLRAFDKELADRAINDLADRAINDLANFNKLPKL